MALSERQDFQLHLADLDLKATQNPISAPEK
jgi:hypothetical protein